MGKATQIVFHSVSGFLCFSFGFMEMADFVRIARRESALRRGGCLGNEKLFLKYGGREIAFRFWMTETSFDRVGGGAKHGGV